MGFVYMVQVGLYTVCQCVGGGKVDLWMCHRDPQDDLFVMVFVALGFVCSSVPAGQHA